MRLLLIVSLTFNNSLSKTNGGERKGGYGMEITSQRTEIKKGSQIILGERGHLYKGAALQKQKAQQ